MRRADRFVGLARSVAIYHLIPRRQRRLRTLYAQWLRPGDLVFDVGAHVGNRTRAFAALGCRVVAVEPQPHVAALLRVLAGRVPDVTVVEAAVTDRPGRARLAVSDRNPTVSTISDAWRDARGQEAGFAGVEWNRMVDVAATTLDALIAEHGEPAFVKLDMEGGEVAALRGLTMPVKGVSFEYLGSALDAAEACASHLAALAPYRFNWSAGESSRLGSDTWLDHGGLIAQLSATAAAGHGDVYARRVDA
jgi:FkbM family methyltransferase